MSNSSAPSASSAPSTPTAAPSLLGPTVSTQWLADHLGSENLVVVDTTVLQVSSFDGRYTWLSGLDQYLVTGHIPSSVFADLIEEFSDPRGAYGFARPDAARFEAAATEIGVDNESTVVVYDAGVGQWASRLWWLFRTFGYDRVAVLDGGLAKWKAEGRPLETGHVQPRTGAGFRSAERPELWVGKEHVASIVDGRTEASLVCGLPPKEFAGLTGQRSRLGHIPGSLSAPAGRLVSRETNALLPEEQLRETFEPALNREVPIVAYCAGGIAAAADALALTILGRNDVVVYDGSLNEWSADENAPLATLP